MEKGQIAAPSVPDASKATSKRQVSKNELHGHSIPQSATTPTFVVQGRITRTRSERRPSTSGTTSRALWKRELLPTKAFLSFSFLLPFPEPAGTQALRFASQGLEVRAPHCTMTILGRVMRARSAPRVSVARHELGQAPSIFCVLILF